MFAVERLGWTVGIHVFGLSVPPDIAAFLNVDVEIGAAEYNNALDRSVVFKGLIDVSLEGDDLAASIATVRSYHDACPAVSETVPYAFAAKAAENHAMHSADAGAREHGNGRLGNVRHVNEHTVALLASIALQDVREDADFAVKLLIGEHAPFAGFAFPDDGGLVAARTGKMAVKAIFANVELAANEPFCKRHPPIENLCPLLPPEQIGGFFRPELFGRLDRLRVNLLIFGEGANAGALWQTPSKA